MGNHNRQWIAGRHVVIETLRAGVWIPLELACVPDPKGVEMREARELAHTLGVKILDTTHVALSKLCRTEEHQGMAVRLPEFPFATIENLLAGAGKPPAIVLLDRLHDSHNYGAILRSAEVFGCDGVVVGTRGQSPVNAQVLRSSAGAINHIPIARHDDLIEAARQLKQGGLRLIGTSPDARTPLAEADLSGPVALVVGNEGEGMSDALAKECDLCVRIPQRGRTGSLNAAVSAGVVCYELRRQRDARS
jgi:23S rRNA (guanosine2251-2'-O)-methyltransferase